MKRLSYLFFAVAALGSCSHGIKYTVSGSLGGQNDSVFLFTANGEGTLLTSSPVAKDGTFRLKGHIDAPLVAQLATHGNDLTIVFLEGGDLRLKPGENGGYTVSGSPSNDRLNDIGQKLDDIRTEAYLLGASAPAETLQTLQEQYRDTIGRAITDNLDNLLGAFLFVNSELPDMEASQIRARLAQFTPAMQQTDLLKQAAQLAETLGKTEIGQPYTELNLPDAAGQTIALSSLIGSGKWVLLDFWATWCGPCREELPHLKEAYEHYRDKGFTIYGVSIDSDTGAWRSFITGYDLVWPNVIAGRDGWSPAAEQYGVRSIPTNFLIGPDGRIAARNLRGDALMAKLAELLQ